MNANFLKNQGIRFSKNPKLFAFKMASIADREPSSITVHALTPPALQGPAEKEFFHSQFHWINSLLLFL